MNWVNAFFGLVVIGVLSLMLPEKLRAPRGIRNNNPGNIRENERVNFAWLGEADSDFDPEFEEFKTPEAGIRAMARILNTYRQYHGLNTIEGIIGRWAPPSENDTEMYIRSVVFHSDVPRDKPIDYQSELPAIIAAMIKHENGIQPYPESVIERGIALA